MSSILVKSICSKKNILFGRLCSSTSKQEKSPFETVFSFPLINHFALINRLKVYSILGSTVAVPICGIIDVVNNVPFSTVLSAAYIGATSTALLSIASLPFRNIIGFIYISDDDNYIKISSLSYWGKRLDKVIPVEEWTPISDIKHKPTDMFYLTPQLSDGTKYKMFVKFGKIHNLNKMSILE